MDRQPKIFEDIEVLEDWNSSLPFFPILKQKRNSIEKIEKEHFQEGKLNIFPSSFCSSNDTLDTVTTCVKEAYEEGLIIVTMSMISLMDIDATEGGIPSDIQCEVLVIVPDQPAVVVCVVEDTSSNKDAILQHLLTLTQQITYSVRCFCDEHFSALHGILNRADFKTPATFRETLRNIYERRSRFYHPDALTMGKMKMRKVGLAVLASIAVTDVPWRMRGDFDDKRSTSEKELWFLTREQFDILSETIDVTGFFNFYSLDLTERGGEMELQIEGSSFMVLELAKRWNKLKPTLACTKVLPSCPDNISKACIAEITDITELRQGHVKMEHISCVVAECVTHEDILKLTTSQGSITRCIVLEPAAATPSPGPVTAGKLTNRMDPISLERVTFLEECDAEVNEYSDTFVETSSFHKARRILEESKFLLITGASGDGKTTIARGLCRHFRDLAESPYTPLIIRHPDELHRFVVGDDKQIIVIEDIFGAINLSLTKLLLWEKLVTFMENLETITNFLLVITCKYAFVERGLQLLNRIPTFQKECVLDISMTLTFEDKMNLVQMYGTSISKSEELQLETLILEDDIGFPLSCGIILRKESRVENIFQGFRHPIQFLRRELDNVIRRNSLHYCFLLLLVCSGGTMDINNRDVISRWERMQQVTLSKTQLKELKKVLKEIPKCYIHTHPLKTSLIFFSHQSVFFAALQCLVSKNIDAVLKFANPLVLSNFFILENTDFDACNRTIKVPQSKEQLLLDMFMKDVEMSNGAVFLNESFRNESFAEKFLTQFNQKRLIEQFVTPTGPQCTSPLEYIIMSNNETLLKQLIQHNCFNKLSSGIVDLLILSCKFGNIPAIEIFLPKCQKSSPAVLERLLETVVIWSNLIMLKFLVNNHVTKQQLSQIVSKFSSEAKFRILVSILQAVESHEDILSLTSARYSCSLHGQCTLMPCLVARKETDLIRKLCEIGANINACNDRSESPLHLACHNKDESAVEILIRHGANLEAKTMDGKTPLDYACESESTGILHMLLLSLTRELREARYQTSIGPGFTTSADHGQLPGGGVYDLSTLHLASMCGKLDAIRFLIRSKALINPKDSAGQTPLHLAIEFGQREVVDILLRVDANVNDSDVQQRTPLLLACQRGDYSIAERLIASGTDVNKSDVSGYTPLHVAADREDDRLVKLLLQNKANVDQQTLEKMTALHIACIRDNCSTIKHLFDWGAETTCKDAKGKTPLEYACGKKSIVNTLIKKIPSKSLYDDKHNQKPERCQTVPMITKKREMYSSIDFRRIEPK